MGIRDEVRELIHTESARHKRLIAYVVHQLEGGRDLREILDDPYVTNRISTFDRLALLEEPEVVAAAGDDVLAHLRAELEALARR